MKKLIIRMTLGVLLILGTIGISHASLIGDTVSCSTDSTSSFSCDDPTSAVVGGGNEFTLIDSSSSDDLFDIDILGTSFTISENFSSPTLEIVAGTETFTLSGLDWLNFPNGTITGVSLIGVAGVTGLALSDIDFTHDSVTVDLSETSWSRNSRAGVRLAVSHGAPQFAPLAVPNPTALAVPEPTTLALFGIGLAGMGFARKKRKST
jgi:hypothetical protein